MTTQTEATRTETTTRAIEILRGMREEALDGLAALECDEIGTGREFDLLAELGYAELGLEQLGAGRKA